MILWLFQPDLLICFQDLRLVDVFRVISKKLHSVPDDLGDTYCLVLCALIYRCLTTVKSDRVSFTLCVGDTSRLEPCALLYHCLTMA